MANSGSITLEARTRGMWRLRLWTWLGRLLLRGVTMEWRMKDGTWRPLNATLDINVAVDQEVVEA